MNENLKAAIREYQSTLPPGTKERQAWEDFCQKAFLVFRDVWLERVGKPQHVDNGAPYGE